MLTKKTPETIKASLQIKAMGVENTLLLTFYNRSRAEYDTFVKNEENAKVPEHLKTEREMIAAFNVGIVLFLVKSFDDGTDADFPLDFNGLMELENTWPGTLGGIHKGYHQARNAAVEKN